MLSQSFELKLRTNFPNQAGIKQRLGKFTGGVIKEKLTIPRLTLKTNKPLILIGVNKVFSGERGTRTLNKFLVWI